MIFIFSGDRFGHGVATDAEEEEEKENVTTRVATVCRTSGYAHTRLLQSISRSGYVPPQASIYIYIYIYIYIDIDIDTVF